MYIKAPLRNYRFTIIVFSIFLTLGCNPKEDTKTTHSDGTVDEVITAQLQNRLTPDTIVTMLKSGNQRFITNSLTSRDHSSQVRKSVSGQYPKAIILSCVDSRVPVEDVFDLGIGDVFVTRVAGNIVNEDILGSMEYACKVAGSKLILVLGHEHCGALKAAVDDVKLGNISALLEKIKPSVQTCKHEGERNSKNESFVHDVCENNIRLMIERIRSESPILQEMERNGEIKIIGAVYDMDNGQVDFL